MTRPRPGSRPEGRPTLHPRAERALLVGPRLDDAHAGLRDLVPHARQVGERLLTTSLRNVSTASVERLDIGDHARGMVTCAFALPEQLLVARPRGMTGCGAKL